MERLAQNSLIRWKNTNPRLPLIIQGARQVGKTYLMKWLGIHHFERFAYFNFDERPELKELFELNKDPHRVLRALSMVSGMTLDRNSLVILDEIQECPQALNTLKYFSENCPEVPVVCAGSYLGILLKSGHSFPVGKVVFLDLYPMTFTEVIMARSDALTSFLLSPLNLEPVSEFLYNDLNSLFKEYLIHGGLPAVVKQVILNNDWENSEYTLQNLISSYKGDFGKHPIMSDVARITHVFDSLPAQLGRENKKFVYKVIRPGARAREYENAIMWLVRSGLLYRLTHISKPAIPLSAYSEPETFKLYAFDVGVLRKISRLSPEVYLQGHRLFTEFKGAILENYIMQSLMAQSPVEPHYWTSENKAEVDFVLEVEGHLVPIEVKSDMNVRSKSLSVYHQRFQPKLRIRYSNQNLQYREGLLNIPHFMADRTLDLVKGIINETVPLRSG